MDNLRVGVSKKEIAARAVIRDVWQSGHRCVELRQDGRALVFFCSLCNIHCFSDATLADHLRGNKHARRLSSASLPTFQSASNQEGLFTDRDHLENCKGKPTNEASTPCNSNLTEPFPASSLEWIGSGQVLLQEGSVERQVHQVWCEWYGRIAVSNMHDACTEKRPNELVHAVVIFPYSNAIGRQGEWRPGGLARKGETLFYKEKLRSSDLKRRIGRNCEPPSLFSQDAHVSCGFAWEPPSGEEEGTSYLLSKDLSQKALFKALKRRRLNVLERMCFICHQQMLPGRDVAALMNLNTGQMVCSSRNERGAFHVFHTSCLIDWILLCESKFWSARTVKRDAPRMRGQIRKKPRRGKVRATIQSCGPLFCPECQGTGAEVRGHQLEQPRYRLVQVFDWILELIQARRLWIDRPEQQQQKKCRGLFFLSEGLTVKGSALLLGALEFYAAGSLEFLVSASNSTSRRLSHG